MLNRIYFKKKIGLFLQFKDRFFRIRILSRPELEGKKAEPDPNKRTWIRNTGVNDTAESPGMTLVKLKNHREISL